jgi:hypothetical protein
MCLPAFWHKGLSIKENMSYELYLLYVFNLKKICIPLFFQLSFVTVVFDYEHIFFTSQITSLFCGHASLFLVIIQEI